MEEGPRGMHRCLPNYDSKLTSAEQHCAEWSDILHVGLRWESRTGSSVQFFALQGAYRMKDEE